MAKTFWPVENPALEGEVVLEVVMVPFGATDATDLLHSIDPINAADLLQ